jgi:hypothetical protein
MYPNHHRMSTFSHRGMGIALKMHRLKGRGYGSVEMSGCGAHKKLEGGAIKKSRKPLSFRF